MKELGRNFILFVEGDDSVLYPVVYSQECTLDVQTDTIEVASRTDGRYRSFRKGRSSWSISASGYYDQYQLGINLEVLNAKQMVKVVVDRQQIGRDGADVRALDPAGLESYEGYAIITSMRLGTPHNGLATFQIELKGTGELTSL